MGGWQAVLSDVLTWAITLLVSAVVWGLVSVGLYQLVRDGIRTRVHSRARTQSGRVAPTASRALAKRSTG